MEALPEYVNILYLRGQGRGSRADEASTASLFSVGRLVFV